MLAAVRRANVGAVVELEARRRRALAGPIDHVDALEREVEWLRAELCAMWLGLPF
jgi:hypothetical protein